jgi:hypothetical protein
MFHRLKLVELAPHSEGLGADGSCRPQRSVLCGHGGGGQGRQPGVAVAAAVLH